MDSKIYITSDLHFGHNKNFLYKPRGFSSIEEHDKTIIKNWNEIIKPNDHVYILGDLMLNDNDAGMRKLIQLMGNLHIVIGNHDTDSRIDLYSKLGINILEIDYAYRLKYKGLNFFLTHYPTLTSNWDYDKPLKSRVINLCAHTHTKDKWADWDKGLIYHCELDAHNNKPILIDNIIIDIKNHILKDTIQRSGK